MSRALEEIISSGSITSAKELEITPSLVGYGSNFTPNPTAIKINDSSEVGNLDSTGYNHSSSSIPDQTCYLNITDSKGSMASPEIADKLKGGILRGGKDYFRDRSPIVARGRKDREKKTIVFYVPNNLDLEAKLAQHYPDMLRHKDKLYYVLDKLYVMAFLDKRFSSSSSYLPFLSQNSSSSNAISPSDYNTITSLSNNPFSTNSFNTFSSSSLCNAIPSPPFSSNTPFHNNNMNVLHTYGVYSEGLCTKPKKTRKGLGKRKRTAKEPTKHGKRPGKREYIRLNTKILRRVLTCELARPIMEALTSLNFAETDNQYILGEKSRGYKLTLPYRSAPFTTVTIADKRFHNKLVKIKEREILNLSPLHQQIYQNLSSFSFDLVAAEALLDQMNGNTRQFLTVRLAIDKIQKQDFFFSTDRKTGRIFHNYCNLKKEFRQCILDADGLTMVDIDICNSQPFFLALMLKESLVESDNVLKYIALTVDGQLYDHIGEKYSMERTYVKKLVFTLFFCRNNQKAKLKEIFQEEFPDVNSFIEEVKGNDYKNLSIQLQKLEASMMIDTIGQRLLEKGITFITIHDSFMVSAKDVEITLHVMKEAFMGGYGVVPKFGVTRGDCKVIR
ncbi:MAG: hypothetical protein NTZ35_01495 [Ignavibacteriales bacterium]|nr:hypothetical protein [Ignavibacteriales bacterium]